MKRALLAAAALALVLHASLPAQQVGPNVNVLAGTAERTGDAFLQRQNEAVVAISTRNSDHVMVAMNDYRTVDFVDTTPEETDHGLIARRKGTISIEAVRAATPPEAWIGLAFSRDRGQTWYTGLLPGYPQDPTSVGQSSPVYGDSAGSDPVLITGQNGRVYLIALTFDRTGISRISATRYTDHNNVEGGEPFYYDFTRQIAKGSQSSKGRFADKPSGAAHAAGGGAVFSPGAVAKNKKQVVVLEGCERVYTAYTVFEGVDSAGNFRNNVYAAVSASCGESWSNPIKISGPYSMYGATYPGTRNQGTSTAVDPDTGHVYVTWRTYEPNGFVYVRSTDGGLTWSAPKALTSSPVYPFDQPLIMSTAATGNAMTFRSNAYPSMLMYAGTLLAAWQERVDPVTGKSSSSPTSVPRIVLTRGTPDSAGNYVWTAPTAVDLKDPGAVGNRRCELEIPEGGTTAQTVCRPTGAQLMPHLTAREGQVALAYYESRHQEGNALDPSGAPGGIAPTGYISGMQRQVDTRAAIIDPSTWTTVSSFEISRYQRDPRTGRIMENPNAPDPLLRRKVNYANYPMFRGGFASFIGDYLHGIPLRADGSNPGFRFVFTSNELVVPPPDLDFTKYDSPQSGKTSNCNPGSRNATIMTSEVGTGLVLGSPGTFKQLLDSNNQPLQRAFAVYVENHTPAVRGFRLTFEGYDPALVTPSFEQFSIVPQVDLEVLGGSSVTRSVYLTSRGMSNTSSVTVRATEIQLGPPTHPNPVPAFDPPLTASLALNSDPTNPFVGSPFGGNPDLANTETHTPQLGTPQLGTPQLGTPQLGTPQLGTPQLGTPQLSTSGEGGEDNTYTDVTFDVENAGNTASGFNALAALGTAPHLTTTGHSFQVFVYRVHTSATVDGCTVGVAPQDQVIYQTPQLGTPQLGTPQLGTPQLGTPQLGTPQLGTPQLGTPQLGTPQLSTASFSVSPADPTPGEHDGTEHQHQGNDRVRLTVRVIHPPGEDFATAHPDPQAEFVEAVAVAVAAQAVDTVDANNGVEEPTVVEFDPSDILDLDPGVNFVVTNTSDDGNLGSLRFAINEANASAGHDTIRFNIAGAGPHTITPSLDLPEITESVTIDGLSQPGYAGTPLIVLDGAASEGGTGLWVSAGNSVIRGLSVNGFSSEGIRITGAGGNFIVANHVGVITGNGNGIQITGSPDNVIGGADALARNVVSGNGGEGIRLDTPAATGNIIRGNYIGLSDTGLADLGNTNSGVYLRRARANFVVGNIISGNDGFAGVAICGGPTVCGGGVDTGPAGDADGNVVQGNLIGANPAGPGALPNSGFGVSIDGASNTVVGGTAAGEANLIANNGLDGVVVFNPPAAGNQIRGNSIHSNGGLGIDLRPSDGAGGTIPGVTQNDASDQDTGSNNLQNFPTITDADAVNGTLLVSGTLHSAPSTTFTIDVYANAACDVSGHGEGATYVGSTTVTTNTAGDGIFDAAFTSAAAPGSVITTTATNPDGDTSEFSACVTATAGTLEIASVTLDSTTLTIGGTSVPYTATLINGTEDTLSTVLVQAYIQQDASDASRAAGFSNVSCDSNPASGVFPPGTCGFDFTVLASNTTAGTGTLVPGSAIARFELRQGATVLDTFIVPVTLVAPPIIIGFQIAPDIRDGGQLSPRLRDLLNADFGAPLGFASGDHARPRLRTFR